MTWVSIDRPELKLTDEEVWPCETCGGGGQLNGWPYDDTSECPDCDGWGMIHGWHEVRPNVYKGRPARRLPEPV